MRKVFLKYIINYRYPAWNNKGRKYNMVNKQTPIFTTERLILRAVTLEDAEAYEKYFVDYEVIRQLTAVVPWPYPTGGVLDYIQTQILPKQGIDNWTWGIFLKSDPEELIGAIGLWREATPENRGFWLGKKFWGQGIMTEAVVPVMDYAFDNLGFKKLIFANAAGNYKSRRIKEKTGARLIAVTPAKYVNPLYSEREVWQLTKKEWQHFKNIK